MSIEDDDRWCVICGKDADACRCDIGPSLNDPDGEAEMFDDDSMPTPCQACGEVFDLYDGKPCHKCHVVFCPECSRDTDDGWRCYKCKPEKKCRNATSKSAKKRRPNG